MARCIYILFLVSVLIALSAAPARAGELAVEDGVLVYTADPGDADFVAAFPACLPLCTAEVEQVVTVYVEDVAAITPGLGCAPAVDASFIPFPAYQCVGVTEGAHFELGDQDDYAEAYIPGDAPVTILAGDGNDFGGAYDGDDVIDGGPGNDELYGGHGDDQIAGGDGNDEINGDYGAFANGEEVGEDLNGAGADRLDGGGGDDRLQGNGGADLLAGGAGTDTAIYRSRKQPVTVTIDGQADDGEAGERDEVSTDIEAVVTGLGGDTVRGSDGANTITTGMGDDTVDPSGGQDTVDTGEGSDRIEARDGAIDKIGCGDGADSASLDAADVAGADCEQPARPDGAAPSAAALARVRPRAVALRAVGTLRRGARRVRLAGELQLPPGTDRALCAGTAVTVTIKAPRVQRVTTVLGADCRFSLAVPVRLRGGRVLATAHFHGTSIIEAASSQALRLRVRRRG